MDSFDSDGGSPTNYSKAAGLSTIQRKQGLFMPQMGKFRPKQGRKDEGIISKSISPLRSTTVQTVFRNEGNSSAAKSYKLRDQMAKLRSS
jgi:hypothetical protein